ncbi:MAG TPA: hypothetical protein VF771_13390 [Longimicrobiaceae bacterium]
MQPIRVAQTLEFTPPLRPDPAAVLRGIETELIFRGSRTLRLTADELVFAGPGVWRALMPLGGPTTWLVRGGRITPAGMSALRVQLELDPVSLFLVPFIAAAALTVLPLTPGWRAGLMLAGLVVWAGACIHAWRSYRRRICDSARHPWYTAPAGAATSRNPPP